MPLRIARSTERCFGRTAMGPGAKRAEACTRQAPSGFGCSWRQQNGAGHMFALLSEINQVDMTSRLLPCTRFDVGTESLVFRDSYNGHSSLLAAEGLEPASRKPRISESPRPIYLDVLPQIHLLKKRIFRSFTASGLRKGGYIGHLGNSLLRL